MKFKVHSNDNKKTLWENFEANISDTDNIREVMGALSVVNAQLIGISNDESMLDEKMLEIVEFGDKFTKKYGKKTKKARYENWGQEAFALRLYEDIKENAQFEIEILRKLEKATVTQKEKAVKLGNTICRIQGFKRLTFCFGDGALTIGIPKETNKIDNYLIYKALFNNALSEQCGVIISRENYDGSENIYGFRTDGKYNVEAIGVEELKWSYSVDAVSGARIPVPSGLRFKELKISM